MIFDNVRCQVRNCMKHTPHVCISLIFSNVSDAQSLVFCVVLLSAIVFFVLFFCHCIVCTFFELHLLATPFVSANISLIVTEIL